MGRKRKPGFDWLPPRVYPGRSQFELRPRDMSTIKLCAISSDRATVWRRYQEELTRLEAEPDPGLFASLLNDYLASREFEKLAEETQRAYGRYAEQLRAVFGDMPTNDIEPVDIREWLDARAAAKSETLANREFAMLGSVFRWGRERGRCAGRPTKDVRRFSEQPRDRDVTEAELAAFRAHCGPRLNAYLDLRMATGLRQGEVLLGVPISALRAVRAPLNDDDPGVGLPFDKPSKNGLKRPYKWSPGLQKAADAILALEPRDRTYTWPAARGGKLTQDGFANEWKRAMKRYRAAGGEPFREHDLRASAVADLTDEHAQLVLGHRNIGTTRRSYKRRPRPVEPPR